MSGYPGGRCPEKLPSGRQCLLRDHGPMINHVFLGDRGWEIKGYSHKEFVAKWVKEDGYEYRSLLRDGWQAMPVTRRWAQNSFWAIIVWNEREAIEYWQGVCDGPNKGEGDAG